MVEKAFELGLKLDHEKVKEKFSAEEWKYIIGKARYIEVAMEIRKLRKINNLSQGQFATKVGVKREYVSRIESGCQNMNLKTLIKIASAVGKEFKFRFE
jgi:DNA-binding XRE family transcriptional regulator